MATLVDLVKIVATSTGDGPISLGQAVSGFRGTEALIDGAQYSYSIQQGTAYEFGRCTYLASGAQIVRSPLGSSLGGTPIALTQNAQISFVALSEDLDSVTLSNDAIAAASAAATSEENAAGSAIIAETQAANAATQASNAAAQASNAATLASNAAASANAAQAAAASVGLLTSVVSTGGTPPYTVTGITLGTAGSGATVSGEFDLIVSGGPSGHAAKVTVSGGAITSARIVRGGLSTSNSAPTYTLPTIAGLTGATAPTATVGQLQNTQTFWALSSDGQSQLLWQVSGGVVAAANGTDGKQVAQPLTSYITSQLAIATAWAAQFRVIHGGSGSYYAIDSNENIGWYITPTLLKHPDYDATKALATTGAAAAANIATTRKPFGYGEFWATDLSGNKGWGITPSTIYHPTITALQTAIQAAASGSKPTPSAQWDSIAALGSFMHFQIYGQSNAGVFNTTPVNTVPVTYAKKFSSGVFPTNGTGAGSTLDNLYESGQESPASGAARMIAQLLLNEDGFDITSSAGWLFFSDEWSSSKKASDLAPGSLYFDTYLVGQRTNAKTLADGANKTYASGALMYQQGEADYSANTNPTTWQGTVRTIRTTAESGFQTSSGLLARPLPMVLAQTSTHLNSLVGSRTNPTIALAQLALASEDYYAMFPTHFMDYQSADNLHFTSNSAVWMAAYYGLYLKRWLWDRAKPSPGLAIKSVVRLGSKLLVTMDVGAHNLVLDSAPGVANYGITLDDGTGTAITVSGVTQTGRATFEVQAAASIPSGAKLRNAWIGNGYKGQSGIRDDQGRTLIYDPNGLALPMHNWAPISETTVA